MTDSDRLNEIRERCEKATDGPWCYCGDERGGCPCGAIWSEPADAPVLKAGMKRWGDGVGMDYGEFKPGVGAANASFAAHSREDIPWLLSKLAEARAEAQKWEAREKGLSASWAENGAENISLKESLAEARERAFEEAAQLFESIDPYCDQELKIGGGAMGAVIRYRDEIRKLARRAGGSR